MTIKRQDNLTWGGGVQGGKGVLSSQVLLKAPIIEMEYYNTNFHNHTNNQVSKVL